MKINKKLLFLLPIIIAIILFAGLYIYFNKEDVNSFTASERKWLQENINTRENFEIINDYPIYGEGGVFTEFIDSFEEATGLEFNIVPYYRSSTPTNENLRFRVVRETSEITENDILLNEDIYVAIGKTEKKVDQISDFENVTFGVLKDDVGDVSYYLKTGRDLTYKTYDDVSKLFNALDNSDVDMVIVPNIMYLDYTISNEDYHINYILTEMSNKIVLSLGDNKELGKIVKKYFKKWCDDSFIETYNKTLLDYYIEKKDINDKTKAEILSKTYVYGFVENYPYEAFVKDRFVGITAEYINRITRLSGIEFEFKEYKTLDDLKAAINNKEVDMFFNYYNIENDNYQKTVSTYIERYAVLGKLSDYHVVNSFESLKGKKVSLLDNTALYSYFKNNSKANIEKYDSLKKLLKESKDNLLVIDNEVYNYYRNTKFKDYELLYSGMMTNDYYFMINSEYQDFYNLFNYIINTNSYYNYRNNGLNSLNVSIWSQSTFQELYIILLAVILIPLIVLGILFLYLRRRKKIKTVKKEERKKYTDMLTSLKNRNYLNLNIKTWNESKKYPQAIVIIDLNNVNYVNDNYGYEAGDKLIVKAASMLVNTQLEKSEIIRTDGNEFLIYLVGYSEQQVATYTKKLSKEMKNLPYHFGAAIGYSMILDDIKTIDDAINEATLDMKTDKEEYK
ncbi:MAG: diguanylate cyclase domain-containing protein [Bacilli bacterium]